MERRPAVDLQAISVELQHDSDRGPLGSAVEDLAALYLRALDEIGYRRKPGRKPNRVRDAPRRKSVRGVTYGA